VGRSGGTLVYGRDGVTQLLARLIPQRSQVPSFATRDTAFEASSPREHPHAQPRAKPHDDHGGLIQRHAHQ
jgi:hypothetical protein